MSILYGSYLMKTKHYLVHSILGIFHLETVVEFTQDGMHQWMFYLFDYDTFNGQK